MSVIRVFRQVFKAQWPIDESLFVDPRLGTAPEYENSALAGEHEDTLVLTFE